MDGASEVEVDCLPAEHGGILGAQMLGQAVSACETATPGKVVMKLSMNFLRPSRCTLPVRVARRHISNGRRFAVVEVDFEQEGRLVARGEALLGPPSDHVDALDVDVDVEVAGTPTARALWPWEILSPTDDPSASAVWTRVPIRSLTPRASRSLLAYATEPLTVPLVIDRHGMRERGGEIPQAVLSHSITFAAAFDARDWHLHQPEIVGQRGQIVTGRGAVLDRSGRCVATTETVASVEL
ncbi:acyl-CoA thioesterase domain-containing protein [Nocardioides gansuensis]|nr:acyl-CoA thioesterase domain-containing protein [Nocardioides gansuensis]